MFGAAANELVSGWLGQASSALGSEHRRCPKESDVTAKMTGTIEKPHDEAGVRRRRIAA